MKSPISLFLCFCLLSTINFVPISSARLFTDVGPTNPHFDAIYELESRSVIKGYNDGTFQPENKINRAEFLKITLETRGNFKATNKNTLAYTDMEERAWFTPYVQFATEKNIVSGYPDKSFRPTSFVNLAEALKILFGVFELPTVQFIRAPDHWYEYYTSSLSSDFEEQTSLGLKSDIGRNISRGEMASLVLFIEEKKQAGEISSLSGASILPPPSGSPLTSTPIIGPNIGNTTPSTGSSTTNPPADPGNNGGSTTPPPASLLQLPVIIGFSTPADVLNPGQTVKQQITAQVQKGIFEVPIFLGGNVSPDGTALHISGQIPNLAPFMTFLTGIEQELNLPANTLKIRGYLRASLTQADANANPNGPGILRLDANINAVRDLIMNLGKNSLYGIDPLRVQEITLDLEDLTASNFDLADLQDNTDLGTDGKALGSAERVMELIRALPALGSGRNFKIGLYSLGILDKDWFPSETQSPGSPFASSPRNFISQEDLQELYSAGLDIFEVGAYSSFPQANGAGGFADASLYGPIHADYEAFLVHHVNTVRALQKSPETNLRFLLPVYNDPAVVNLSIALTAMQRLITTGAVTQVQGGVFDFGSMDEAEKNQIMSVL